MKSIVVYDSNFGNTRLIAEAIALELKGQACSVKDFDPGSLKDTDLLIVGSPINAWRPTARIKDLLNTLDPARLAGVKAAAFDTRIKMLISGNAARKIAGKLSEKGAVVIAEPKGFYVRDKQGPLADGEIANAKAWAQKILKEPGLSRN